MSAKLVSAAAQADADICNVVVGATRGRDAGTGTHITIPADWQARIASGLQVPGCTYYSLQSDGSLFVDDRVQLQLSLPAVINALTAGQQAQAAALNAKLATAQIVSAQALAPEVINGSQIT